MLWLLVMALLAPSSTARRTPSAMMGMKAPPITSNRWINTEPLRSQDLEGRVVLVQFWAFENVGSHMSVPAMRKLRAMLPGTEVVIVSVHSPRSPREEDLRHLEDQMENLDVDYPVAVDNDHAVWNSFRSRHWPTLYVVDRRGIIRHFLAGELLVGTKRWDALVEVVGRLRKEAPDSVGVR